MNRSRDETLLSVVAQRGDASGFATTSCIGMESDVYVCNLNGRKFRSLIDGTSCHIKLSLILFVIDLRLRVAGGKPVARD